MNNCRIHNTVSWIFQFMASAILAVLVILNFSGTEEMRSIFTTLGAEPWGRVATGCAELAALVLLLAPRTTIWGALFSLGLMAGIMGSQITRLGMVVQEDGGLLFSAALTVFVCAAIVLLLRRTELPLVGSLFASKLSSCTRPVGKESGEESRISPVDHSV